MIPEIAIKKNVVTLNKQSNPGYEEFVYSFLTKTEETLQPERSYGTRKRKFRVVHELQHLYTENMNNIKFSRGLLSLIPEDQYLVVYQTKDEYQSPSISFEEIKNILPTFELRDDQAIAVRKCLFARRGVIQMPTATGKSAIIASVLKILHKANPTLKSLVIAPTLSTIENMEDTLTQNGLSYSFFGHPDKKIVSNITTALVPSLIKHGEIDKDFLKDIGLVIYDECHHLKCDTWNMLNTLLPNVEFAFGFSALSISPDEITLHDTRAVSYDTALIVGSSGPVLMHMDASYYIEHHIIAQPAVFRLGNRVNLPNTFDESDYPKVVKYGIMAEDRTNLIAQVSRVFNKYGRKILILVSEKEHAFTLAKALVKQGITSYGMSFGAGVGYLYKSASEGLNDDGNPDLIVEHQKEKSLEVLNKLKTGEIDVLIGTSHIDEGVDISNLDVTILAGGGKKDRRIIQRLGRVLRRSKTGKYAYVIDFMDDGSRVLSKHSVERLNLYRETISIPEELIFNNCTTEFLEAKFKELEEIT